MKAPTVVSEKNLIIVEVNPACKQRFLSCMTFSVYEVVREACLLRG